MESILGGPTPTPQAQIQNLENHLLSFLNIEKKIINKYDQLYTYSWANAQSVC